MTADLFGQGLELMLVGMGTVFVFLSALVLATTAMSRLVLRFQGEPPAAGGAGAEEAEEVAAISAAIALHRRRR
ncbi:MAG: sodium pump decarboxylase subunit gamma [Gammaproteobacteria bacterium]|jgi:oxaloacetate decarboxylase gamma subunit|nr:sodium pump decarboxylase subunit gamma [Gammaproteobacteria bacterium]